MRILVLEDHVGIRSALELLLEWDGHQVVAFERGESALQFLRQNDVDFVLMDWNTPGVCGRAFLEQLDDTCLPLFRPAVGVLSGDEAGRSAIDHFGAKFFHLKPFPLESVIEGLNRSA